MDQTLNSASGTAPPNGSPRRFTLEQIPRYVELYRKTGRPPRIHVKKPCRFNRIDLPTKDRWVLALSDNRTFLLQPGTNTFEPPLVLQAGTWFRLRRPARASAERRTSFVESRHHRLPGWGDELFNSLLLDSGEQSGDELVSVELLRARAQQLRSPTVAPASTSDKPTPPAGGSVPPAQATAAPVPRGSSTPAGPTPAFTFGRSPREDGLFARIRRLASFRDMSWRGRR